MITKIGEDIVNGDKLSIPAVVGGGVAGGAIGAGLVGLGYRTINGQIENFKRKLPYHVLKSNAKYVREKILPNREALGYADDVKLRDKIKSTNKLVKEKSARLTGHKKTA